MEEKLKKIFAETKPSRRENCPEDTLLVFYVEGRLRKAEKNLVEGHLKECPYCLERVVDLKETEYLYELSRKGSLKRLLTSVKEFFTQKKLILAFASVIVIFAVLFSVELRKKSLPIDPASIVKIQAVDAAEKVKTEIKGFVLSDGYILTPLYPVSGAKKLKLQLSNGSIYEVNEILADRERNIALIKVDALPSTVKPLSISDTVMAGQDVFLIPVEKGSPVKVTVSDFKPQTTRKTKKDFVFVQLVSEKEASGEGIVVDKDGKPIAVTSTKEGKIIFAGLLKEALTELKNKKTVKVETVKDKRRIAEALYYYFKGILAVDSKKEDLAEQYLKKAIELDPELEGAYLELAGIYYDKRLYDLEIEQYKKVIAINPENADALFFLAQAYETKGWYEKAIELYKRVIELDPEDAEAIFNLGLAYLTVGDKARAMQLYPELKRLDPGFAEKLKRLAGG